VSRIGKKPIEIPSAVTINQGVGMISVKGPKGTLQMYVSSYVSLSLEDGQLSVARIDDLRLSRAAHGLTRTLISNMVHGVTDGYSTQLDIVGVGYRAELKGKLLQLNLGYSHSIVFAPPTDITVEVPLPTQIVIKGIDKQLVGQVAAKIRALRPPEPYKGKGIKYSGEQIRRKAGKAAGKGK
jgi:large subunit ribosomal protein L6